MKTKTYTGPHSVLDPGIYLNAVSGRKLSRLRPLAVGSHARIRFGTVLYAGTRIGPHFETGHHAVIREQNRIGHHVSIWNQTTVDYGCVIGHRVKIHCQCYIAQYSVIEDDVFIAPGVVFANDRFPKARDTMRVLQGPIIRKGALIGAACTVLPGIEIGAGAFIGSGSVVTQNIPPRAVAWGNPARVRKQVSDLRWPLNGGMQRREIRAFYQKRLAGRLAYGK